MARVLHTDPTKAESVIDSFRRFVSKPLTEKFEGLKVFDIAKRNPFVYAALGISDVDVWVNRVLADKLTSSTEGLLGNWLEEVARIMSKGFKPASGSDLQIELPGDVVELYAIQSTVNTKNAGGSRSDIEGRKKGAGALRAQRRHVKEFVGYVFGRTKTTERGGVTHLASDEFWMRITGSDDFLSRLLDACTMMGALFEPPRIEDQDHLRQQAREIYAGADGRVDWQRVLTIRSATALKRWRAQGKR